MIDSCLLCGTKLECKDDFPRRQTSQHFICCPECTFLNLEDTKGKAFYIADEWIGITINDLKIYFTNKVSVIFKVSVTQYHDLDMDVLVTRPHYDKLLTIQNLKLDLNTLTAESLYRKMKMLLTFS